MSERFKDIKNIDIYKTAEQIVSCGLIKLQLFMEIIRKAKAHFAI